MAENMKGVLAFMDEHGNYWAKTRTGKPMRIDKAMFKEINNSGAEAVHPVKGQVDPKLAALRQMAESTEGDDYEDISEEETKLQARKNNPEAFRKIAPDHPDFHKAESLAKENQSKKQKHIQMLMDDPDIEDAIPRAGRFPGIKKMVGKKNG
jgi:hypothetical protein